MAEERKKRAALRLPGWLRGALFALLQWTWGLPQNLIGLMLLPLLRCEERFRFHGALVTRFKKNRLLSQKGAFSLGTFIYIPAEWGNEQSRRIAVHEYGHSVQSLILGPLYLPLVGLPSVIWAGVWAGSKRLVSGTAAEETPSRVRRAPSAAKLQRARRTAAARYTSHYPENWANALGEYATGEKPPEH